MVLEAELRDFLWDELADSRIGFAAIDYERMSELTEGRSRDLEHAQNPTSPTAAEPGPVRPPDAMMTDEVMFRTARHRRARSAFFALPRSDQATLTAAYGRCTLPKDVEADLRAAWGNLFGVVALEPALIARAYHELEPWETPAGFMLRLAHSDAETLFRIGLARGVAAKVADALQAYQRARNGHIQERPANGAN